jgi:DNA-binding transcriptional LysR family regulator
MSTSLARLGIDMASLRTVIMVRNAGAMARCLSSGMGAAITSRITVEPELQSGALVTLDLPELRMERSFYVVFNAKRSLFPAALKLVDYLRINAENHARLTS